MCNPLTRKLAMSCLVIGGQRTRADSPGYHILFHTTTMVSPLFADAALVFRATPSSSMSVGSTPPDRSVVIAWLGEGDPSSAVDYLGHVGEISNDRFSDALTPCDQMSEVCHRLQSIAWPSDF